MNTQEIKMIDDIVKSISAREELSQIRQDLASVYTQALFTSQTDMVMECSVKINKARDLDRRLKEEINKRMAVLMVSHMIRSIY